MTQLFVFFHVLCAAVWLGAALWVSGDLRRTLSLGKPFVEALPARVGPALELDLWTGVATVLTGLAVLALLGGRPRLGIMIGFGLALLRLALTGALVRPTYKHLAQRISGGEEIRTTDAAVKRVAMLTGINHTLWVGALVGMVFGF